MKWINEDQMKLVVGIAVILNFTFLTICVVFVPHISDNKLAFHLLGIIEGFVGGVVFFYFGTSKNSEDKDKRDYESKFTKDG